MTRTIIGRLMWKDARSLAGVWLSLLAAVVTLQFAVMMFQWNSAQPGELWRIGIGILSPIIACLAVTVAGILFAGEAEERTDEWLRVLPIPPRTLAFTKLAVALLSVVAFLAVGTLSAGLLHLLFGVPGLRARGDLLLPLLGAITGLCSLGIGILMSLHQRRVVITLITSFGAAMVLILGASLVITPLLDAVGLRGWAGAVVPATFALIVLLDLRLLPRWATAGPIRLGRGLRTFDLTPVQSVPSLSTLVLGRAANLGGPGARASAVLVWQELRAASRFLVYVVALATLLAVGILLPIPFGALSLMGQLLLLMLIPLAAGLATARDGASETQRFLGERGVSPGRIWLVRQGVWIAAAMVAFVWVAVCFEVERSRIPGNREGGLYLFQMLKGVSGELARPFLLTERTSRVTLSQQWTDWKGAAVADCAALFAIGQVCGFWFRRSVLSFGLALVVAIPVLLFHRLISIAGVSYGVVSWPMSLLWLVGTWWLMDAWLTGAASRQLVWRRAAWLVVPPLISAGLFAAARVTQVPHIDRPQPVNPALLAANRMQDVSSRASIAWRNLSKQLESAWPTTPAGRAALAGEIHAFAELRRGDSQIIDPSLTRLSLTQHLGDLREFTETYGRELRSSGQLSAELDLYLDAAWIARRFAQGWPESWSAAIGARVAVARRIQDWANASEQTEATLRAALPRLQRDYVIPGWSIRLAAEEYSAIVDQVVRAAGPFHAAVSTDWPSDSPAIHRVWEAVARGGGEYRRARRLAGFIAHQQEPLIALSLPDRGSIFPALQSWGQPEEFVPLEPFGRWLATTPYLPSLRPDSLQPAVFVATYFDLARSARDELAASQAALLTAALQLYRRVQGEFPRELGDLRAILQSDLPTDPYAGGDFRYFPDGLPHACLLPNGQVLPPGQPLLASPGPYGGNLQSLTIDADQVPGLPDVGPVEFLMAGNHWERDYRFRLDQLLKTESPRVQELLTTPAGPQDVVGFAILTE